MERAVEIVLTEYEERRAREFELFKSLGWQQVRERHDEFLMSIGPDAGLLMNIIIKHAKARRILELGTSYGHSTVFLAEAAHAVGGTVISCDLSAEKQSYARTMLQRASLDGCVEFRTGDAHATIPELTGDIDFVLLDARAASYITLFDLFYSKLSPGAFVAADNITLPRSEEAEAYRRHVKNKEDMESILLPVEQGIELSRCVRRGM
jgi:predicted O-methyltransferase YrrM